MKSKSKSRPLSYFETLLYCAHQKHTSQMTLSLKLSGNIDQEHFQQAFSRLTKKHPLLRSIIQEVDGILCYQIKDSLEIPITFYDSDESNLSYDDLLQQESQQQLLLNEKNFSVAILEHAHTENSEKHFAVIWHISHVVADGLSFVNLTKELVEILESLVNNKLLTEVTPYALPLSVEKYLLANGVSLSLDEFESRKAKAASIQLKKIHIDKQATSSYFFRSVTDPHLSKLKQYAAYNKVSLNNLINAAWIKAYFNVTGSSLPVTFGSALSLRNKCGNLSLKNICGNFFCPVTSVFASEELQLSPIDLAILQRNKLGEILNAKFYLPTTYDDYLDMQTKVKSFMLKDATTQAETLSSSFIGEIDISPKFIKLEHFSIHPKNPHGNNLITTIFKGEMLMMFCFSYEFRSLAWADSLANETLKMLLSMIEDFSLDSAHDCKLL